METPSLSILVLLPESTAFPGHRPSVPSLHSGPFSPSSDSSNSPRRTLGQLDAVHDDHARRLSLATGLGAGLKPSTPLGLPSRSGLSGFTPSGPPSPLSGVHNLRSQTTETSSLPSSPGTLAADVKAHQHVRALSATRPDYDSSNLTAPSLKIPRGSVAFDPRMRAGGVRRPVAVGDDLVNILRQGGLEVTAVRQATHLPGILASGSSNATFSRLSTPNQPDQSTQQVILCPLGETPSLPSLSLLLSRGTTPTAVCYQQDILDHARKREDEWLAAALSTIQHVEQLCSTIPESPADSNGGSSSPSPHPVIIAYVTSGTLSASAVQACIDAGAFGVLHPPYGVHTVPTVKQLVAAGLGGKTDTIIELSCPASHTADQTLDDETKVILTPTALGLGAEHEGERVLSAFAHTHRNRRFSTQLNLTRVNTGSTISVESELHDPVQTPGQSSSVHVNVAPPTSTFSHFPSINELYDPLGMHTAAEARRRSVDTGGIALAFDRASKRMVPADEAAAPHQNRDMNVVAGDEEQEAANHGRTTQFAEVLGEMYHQTMSSIDIQMGEYEALSAPLPREERERLVKAMATWDFQPHKLEPGDLYRIACLLFESILHTEGIADLNIGPDQVNRFLFAVRAIYHSPNPYHNYVHAIDVLQATYHFLMAIGLAPPIEFLLELEPGKSVWKRPSEKSRPSAGRGTTRARAILRPQDVLALMIAAIGHDVGHPGLSNAFMKNAKVPLSVVYADKSVLENMHCMLIVHLLRKHNFGFLLGAAPAAEAQQFPARAAIDTRGFRRVLYSAILATDMALHFAWIQRLKDFGAAMEDTAINRDNMCEEDRVMLCQALIKCADISNPTRPIDVSEHWSTVLLDEWTKQASLEEELDLPVSVAAGVDARMQASGQINFINLFTDPLFSATAAALAEMRVFADACETNRSIWQSRLELLDSDAEMNEARTAALRMIVRPPLASSQDERFTTLFPLILPPTLVHSNSNHSSPDSPSAPFSLPQSPSAPRHPASPAVQAVRVVYRDEVHDRSMLARHVLALTGFDSSAVGSTRRMSTPEVLLVHSRS